MDDEVASDTISLRLSHAYSLLPYLLVLSFLRQVPIMPSLPYNCYMDLTVAFDTC